MSMIRTLTLLALFGALTVPASAEEVDVFSGNIVEGGSQIINNGRNEPRANPDGKGRQTWRGLSLGLDFVVNSRELIITQLGVWDDNGDGLSSDHILSIYDITGGVNTLLADIEVQSGTGELRDQYRYFHLEDPLHLPTGTEFSVVVYYPTDNLDSNGNSGAMGLNLEARPTLNTNRGAISNIGSARFGGGDGFPSFVDTGPANRYSSTSFTFQPNPEPSTFVLLGGVLVAAGIIRRRRQKKNAA